MLKTVTQQSGRFSMGAGVKPHQCATGDHACVWAVLQDDRENPGEMSTRGDVAEQVCCTFRRPIFDQDLNQPLVVAVWG